VVAVDRLMCQHDNNREVAPPPLCTAPSPRHPRNISLAQKGASSAVAMLVAAAAASWRAAACHCQKRWRRDTKDIFLKITRADVRCISSSHSSHSAMVDDLTDREK
jgi:hypothetical protein